jgi:hypothetical protein
VHARARVRAWNDGQESCLCLLDGPSLSNWHTHKCTSKHNKEVWLAGVLIVCSKKWSGLDEDSTPVRGVPARCTNERGNERGGCVFKDSKYKARDGCLKRCGG